MNEDRRTPGSGRHPPGLAALFAALSLLACSADGPTSLAPSGGSGGGGGAPAPGDEREPARQTTVTIDVVNRAFRPPGAVDATVSVGVGQKIRWVNHDATPHTVTTVTVPENGKPFNGHLASRADGGEFVFEPRVTGVWDYICQFHPKLMSNGRIVVN